MAKFLLVLMFSPVSPYFAGWQLVEIDGDREQCLQEAHAALDRELSDYLLPGSISWETQMMGPMPKVVAAYCVQGEIIK